jgi:hypothetical protein
MFWCVCADSIDKSMAQFELTLFTLSKIQDGTKAFGGCVFRF